MTTVTNQEKMTTISKDAEVVTLINTFSVAPENQQRIVDMLIDVTENVMGKMPGFINANLHKSLDGTKVINYSQWRSVEDFQAMMKNPEATAHFPEFGKVLTARSEPVIYKVSYTYNP